MKPLLSLVNQNHPNDYYGWSEIHVLAWNYDGRGAALCAVRDDHVPDGSTHYLLTSFFGDDIPNILHGFEDGVILYRPIEPTDLKL